MSDAELTWRGLVRTPHFWLMLVAQCLTAAIAVGVVPDTGVWHRCVAGALLVLQSYGYVAGATWSPPRRPWTDAERLAHGLPPVDGKDGK